MENVILEDTLVKRSYTITEMIEARLSEIPFHTDTLKVKRLFARDFPLHIAVHKILPGNDQPEEYTCSHVHYDSDEINIIISNEKLRYKIRLDDKLHHIQENTSIWIPAGTTHSANVSEGTGFFITIRMPVQNI